MLAAADGGGFCEGVPCQRRASGLSTGIGADSGESSNQIKRELISIILFFLPFSSSSSPLLHFLVSKMKGGLRGYPLILAK